MAYTKYSLTPANNTAAPPDGAPEGMLPSAVNDTMRDMMAQIRDCGDGIRDGTYTMTAPKITGGTITGSTINNSAIGGTTAAAGAFTTLSASGVATFSAGAVGTPSITTTGDTNTGIFFPAADTIAFAEGGAESMRITSTGTVAIGTTTTPTAKLWVESGRVGLSNTYKLGWHSNPAAADFSNYITGDDSTNYVAIGTGASERMRIDSNGTLLLGTTTPHISSILTIQKSLSSSVSGNGTLVNVFNNGATSTTRTFNSVMRVSSTGSGADCNIVLTDNTAYNYFFGGYNGTAYVTVGNSQGVKLSSGGTSWASDSDERLKNIKQPITNALANLGTLRTVYGNYKDDAEDVSRLFLIAQDVQKVYPEAIDVYTDEQQTLGLRAVDLIPVLVASIKELKAELDSVKAELQTLKGN